MAQERVAAMGLADRGRMCAIVRRVCADNAHELARIELAETGIGRADHKTIKLQNIRYVLGTEAMRSEASSDATGLCLIEHAPWGVIGMVLPATHSRAHHGQQRHQYPGRRQYRRFQPAPVRRQSRRARAADVQPRDPARTGRGQRATTMAEATIQTAEGFSHHPGVALLCVTGGPAVVKAAMKFGKRVIAAGPGNPPVVVDETADLDAAASSIILGAGVRQQPAVHRRKGSVRSGRGGRCVPRHHAPRRRLPTGRRRHRSASPTPPSRFDGDGKGCAHAAREKDLIGKDAAVLAAPAGVRVPAGTRPAVRRNRRGPPLRAGGTDDAVPAGGARAPMWTPPSPASVKAEHGYRHTAMIHSRNLENATKMARAMNATLFVQNAPCYASLASAPSYLEPQHRHAHRRRSHHAADLHPRAPHRDRRRRAAESLNRDSTK